jgi:hypothetical protein
VGRPAPDASAVGRVRQGAVAAAGAVAALLVPAVASGAPQIRAEVSSPRIAMGEPFDYVVRATLDTESDASRARLVAPTGPFAAVGPAATERSGRDVRLTQRLACLGLGCVPSRSARGVRLPAAAVVLDGRSASAPPARVAVVPRVPAAVVAAKTPGYLRQTEIPRPDFSPRPSLLAAFALVAAAALVVAAFALVATGRRGRAGARTGAADEYERAVRLLRESAGREAPDRRRAAGLLGRVARGRRGTGLAAAADRVAWSRPRPDAAAVGGLADRADAETR